MKKYIFMFLILCSYLVSCNNKEENSYAPMFFYGFSYVILDNEGNNLLAKDVVDLNALTVECEGYVFDVQPIGRLYESVLSEDCSYMITARVYSDISWDEDANYARFNWCGSWGDTVTLTIKYLDCEWNVVCHNFFGDGDIPFNDLPHNEAWIDGVKSEEVYVGKHSYGDECWAYPLRMK